MNDGGIPTTLPGMCPFYVLDTVYIEYFTQTIIELVKVNTFLVLQINLDSKI